LRASRKRKLNLVALDAMLEDICAENGVDPEPFG